MLTPFDKLQSGANDIIQIVVTTACDLFICSNCTQLLPFRHDYRHMSLDCFAKAVESLRRWPGITALFGGNPCCHPQFPALCEILAHVIPQERRGLWSNNLMGHGELCRRIFYPHARFNLNAHGNAEAAAEMDRWLPDRVIESSRTTAAWHSSILLNHKDFGISEDEWVSLRERCDINQKWSGAVVERDGEPYAYFCEVAAALDGIKGNNYGVPATPGWWARPISVYWPQIQECCDAGCGVPLRRRGHLDLAATYDISPSFIPFAHLQRGRNRVVELLEHGTLPEPCPEATDYMKARS